MLEIFSIGRCCVTTHMNNDDCGLRVEKKKPSNYSNELKTTKQILRHIVVMVVLVLVPWEQKRKREGKVSAYSSSSKSSFHLRT